MDVFVGNFFIHVIYLVTKLFSIGIWSYSQLEQSNSVIWLLPLCICLLIIMVHLRWFTALRKWMLALCIIVSTIAWTAVLFIRCKQISNHIARLQAQNHHLNEKEKAQLKTTIDDELNDRLLISIGTFIMIILQSMGLFAEFCGNALVAIAFGILHTFGFVCWLTKITFFHQKHDVLFLVPLIYSILTIAIFIVFLFEIHNKLNKKHHLTFANLLQQGPEQEKQQETKKTHKPKYFTKLKACTNEAKPNTNTYVKKLTEKNQKSYKIKL